MFIQFPEVHTPIQGMENVPIPNMVTIRQSYDPTKIEDIKGHMLAELEKVENKESYKGKRICITAGSRGIPDLDVMRDLKELGSRAVYHSVHGKPRRCVC